MTRVAVGHFEPDRPVTFTGFCKMEAHNFNPVWLAVLVNFVAIAAAPTIAARFAHKGLLNTLKEKWIDNLRGCFSELFEASERLRIAHGKYHEFNEYGTSLKIAGQMQEGPFQSIIKNLDNAVSDSKAKIIGKIRKIQLLFKPDDPLYVVLKPLVDQLKEAADRVNIGSVPIQDTAGYSAAESKLLDQAIEVLHTRFNEIQGSFKKFSETNKGGIDMNRFSIGRVIEWTFGGIGAGVIILCGQFIFDSFDKNREDLEKLQNKNTEMVKEFEKILMHDLYTKAQIQAMKSEFTSIIVAQSKTGKAISVDTKEGIIRKIDSIASHKAMEWKDIKWDDISWDKSWDKKWER